MAFIKVSGVAAHQVNIRFDFNVNLIFMPLEFVDAIILHELAHLYHLNHSKEFYDLLCTWMPNYKEIMKKNKKNPIPNLY